MLKLMKKNIENLKTMLILLLIVIVVIMLADGTNITVSKTDAKSLIFFVSNDFIMSLFGTLVGSLVGGLIAFQTAKITLDRQLKFQTNLEVKKAQFDFNMDILYKTEEAVLELRPKLEELTKTLKGIENLRKGFYRKVNQDDRGINMYKSMIEKKIEEIDAFLISSILIEQKMNRYVDTIQEQEFQRRVISFLTNDPGIYMIHHYISELKKELKNDLENQMIKETDYENLSILKEFIRLFQISIRKFVDETLPREKKRQIYLINNVMTNK
ncbi:hypothetical protein BOVMAS37_10560 [Streptococcus uberis]